MLVHARPDAPTLADIHRSVHLWERDASKALRAGLPEAVAAYDDHGRIHEGTNDDVLDAAYTAWAQDLEGGRASVLIADSNATVTDLNRLTRADWILAGLVDPARAVVLADGTEASAGDIVITRSNAAASARSAVVSSATGTAGRSPASAATVPSKPAA